MDTINDFVIEKKPQFVTWDMIHDLLWAAHAENRAHGINNSFPELPGDKLQKKIEGTNGETFVAIHNGRLVGTCSYIPKKGNHWYDKTVYGYCCLDGVSPEFRGFGIYKCLCEEREKQMINSGLMAIGAETHEHNLHIIDILLRNGYHKVAYKVSKGHNNVIFMKWPYGAPYPNFVIRFMYLYSVLKYMIKRLLKG